MFDYITKAALPSITPAAPSLGFDSVTNVLYGNATGVWAPNGRVASVTLTGQVAAISATTLYTPPVNMVLGLYYFAKKTTIDGASSTLGALTITYTDSDSVAQSVVVGGNTQTGAYAATSTVDTTVAQISNSIVINAKASVAIQYAMAYASGTTATMAYELKLRLFAI